MKDLIFKYLNRNYIVVKYDNKSLFAKKRGCSIIKIHGNEFTGWSPILRDIQFMFHMPYDKAYSIGERWLEIEAKKIKEAKQGLENE